MKGAIKRFLQKKKLYLPLRYSKFFRLYQIAFKPADIAHEKKETAFYKSFLPSCQLIFDIGANDGHKTEAFLNISKQVVCVEPDNYNFQLLQARFRNKKKRVAFEKKAVSDHNGSSILHIHYEGSAFNTLSNDWKNLLEADDMVKWSEKVSFTKQQAVDTTTLDELITKYGQPDFIKIDVEGHEEKVLMGLTQKIGHLSFEALLPEGRQQLLNCLMLLENIQAGVCYNIAAYEQLLLPSFLAHKGLLKWLEQNPLMHFEVIVRMNP